jgi:hypothetical protein
MTLEHTILITLDRLGALMMPEGTLHIELNLTLPQPVSLSEVRAALRTLESKQWIVSVRDDLTQRLLLKITPAGRATLAQNP